MAIITIPAGSTTEFLQNAINGADKGDIIEFQGNMNLTSAVIIVDKELTMRSTEGKNSVLTQTIEDTRHFTIGADAAVSMHNVTLNGGSIGGGVRISATSGTLNMYEGSVISNCYNASKGGGILNSGTFNMKGGEISGNFAGNDGGGINCPYPSSEIYAVLVIDSGIISGNTAQKGGGVYSFGTFVMNNATISGNTAVTESGGVHNDGTFTMNNGTISNNTAGTNGGGVHNYDIFNMNGGEISGNFAGKDGGGIHSSRKNVNISSGSIVNNTATDDGGGVWKYDLNCLTVAAGVIFSGNSACSTTHRDPANNDVYRANIRGTVWSVGRQGYNNTDINQDGAPFLPIDISDSALLIGNGTDDSNRGNAFIFDFNGNAFAHSSFISNGADYAEMFEWADGNPTDEDRVGYFVTLEGGKIRKANAEDEFVLGVVSVE